MIFYFTATGNSRFVADRIAAATSDRTGNIAECVSNELYSLQLGEGENLGFVIPVYYYGIPVIVSDFLEKLEISSGNNPYSYAILNCGSTTGNAARLIKQALSIDAVFGIKTVDNYVPLSKVAGEAEINERLDKAENEINGIIAKINEKATGTYNPVSGFLPGFMTSLFYPLYKRGRKTKKYYCNDKCTGCGLCKEICPRQAIDIAEGIPVWIKPQCEVCLACLHRCPVSAIEYGKSAGRGQYLNPRIEW